ncbi:serine hydrolase domain-containing protein [Congregibacter litoralis]|uniref:Beta-lactamase class C and other penicillin binding protein n=1 Tax=Congregibacter litoralis KT71 TaxID=314285 RepID=A4A796_9GAMM|nr:serine hydrolase [Congregibacter litoralis]EAQ98165.1 Beta-lactamase class C and other penicillin binding protein [Congregibacter litoralis KT71]
MTTRQGFTNTFLSLIGCAAMLTLTVTAEAIEDERPAGLNGATWQFGPLNRWAYTHMSEVLPSKPIRHGTGSPRPLPGLKAAANDMTVDWNGAPRQLAALMEEQYIDGLLVMKNGRVLFERYAGTLTPERSHLLWSVSKTITGLTAASVAADGLIDLDKTVADYVPALADSGWGPDTLRDVLDMRDGSQWNEDYAAADSTVRRQDCADGLLTGPDCEGVPVVGNYRFLPTVGRMPDRQGSFVYKSGTTDVMAWVLEAATDKRFADLVSQRIWKRIGAEQDAGITVDTSGFTLASGGIHATLRDVGRVGQLILNRGQVGDERLFSPAWIDDIVSRDGSRSWPYAVEEGFRPYYRSFMWGLGDGRGSIQARGVHGQLIHVAPESKTLIVMLSSWPDAEGGAPQVGESTQQRLVQAIEAALP